MGMEGKSITKKFDPLEWLAALRREFGEHERGVARWLGIWYSIEEEAQWRS